MRLSAFAGAVEAEGVLVEVNLQMLAGDAAVSALQPALEVGDHAVHSGQDFVESSPCARAARWLRGWWS